MAGLPWKTGLDFVVGPDDEPTSWAIKPWIPEAGLVELTGEAKEAGKTTFILAMCKAVINGWDFLGFPVQKSPVIFLTEQLGQSLRVQIREAMLDIETDFHVLVWNEVWHLDWEKLMAEVRNDAQLWGAKLLIVDTLPQWAGLEDNAENMTSGALKAVKPLQIACGEGIAVLANRHPNRERADLGAGKSSKGAGTWKGAVDIVLDLALPKNGEGERVRLLTSLSRFEETPKASLIQWERGYNYTYLGFPKKGGGKSLDTLLNEENDGWDINYVRGKFNLGKSQAYAWLGHEVAAGRLVKRGNLWYRPG